MNVHVNLGKSSYDVVIEQGILKRASQELNLNRKVLIVTDKGVPEEYPKLAGSQCAKSFTAVIEGGESHKNLESVEGILKLMLDNGFTRSDCLIAVGGGVVGDLAGFAASLYMRGVDFYNIPTTVLSQVDSSVGGKTGVNFAGVKNIVGAFYQPKKVLIDIDVLKTLPKRQIVNGLTEALKMGLTFDEETVAVFKNENPFEHLESLIQKSVEIKARVVEQDEKESGLRRVLNFGHTLGHGLELNTDGKLFHGECVALGMIPMCSPAVRDELTAILKKLDLPCTVDVDINKALEAISHDKKAAQDAINVITVEKIGSFKNEKMNLGELKERLEMVVKQ